MKILRNIMITGCGMIVVSMLGTMICATDFPINLAYCIPYTTQVANLVEKAGFVTFSAIVTGSATIYFIAIKSKLN